MPIPLMQSLLSLGFHLGHSHDKWKPALINFIYGFRKTRTLQSLDKSAVFFKAALFFLDKMKKFRFPVFFFFARDLDKTSGFYLSRASVPVFSFLHTTPGILTNFKIVKNSSLYFNAFASIWQRRLFPSYVINVVVNPTIGFVREAQYLGIPLIAAVDSSVTYLEDISYPIYTTQFLSLDVLPNLFRQNLGFRFVSSCNKTKKVPQMLIKSKYSETFVRIRKVVYGAFKTSR